MAQTQFESLTTGQQLYKLLQNVDPATTVEQRHFESMSTSQQWWKIYQALGGVVGQRSFEAQTRGQQLYKIYALLAITPIEQRRFESFSGDLQLWYIYAAKGGEIDRNSFLSLTRSQQLYSITGATNILFQYAAGDDIAAKGGTFTRPSLATYEDEAGVIRNAPHNLIRNSSTNLGSLVNALNVTVSGNRLNYGVGGRGFVRQAFEASAGNILRAPYVGTFTISVEVKSSESLAGFPGFSFSIDPGNCTLSYGTNTIAGGVTTEWRRVSMQVSVVAGGSVWRFGVGNPSGLTPVEGWLEIRNWQIEENSIASPYIETTGTARFDSLRDSHYVTDPVTSERVRTTLLEGQRTNLCLQSNAFNGTSPWSSYPGDAVSVVDGPGGAGTGKRITLTTANNTFIYQPVAGLGTGTTFTWSVWLRSNIGPQSVVLHTKRGDAAAILHPDIVVGVTDQWKRFTVTTTTDSSVVGAAISVRPSNGSGIVTKTGEIDVAYCQVEVGAFASSYIPTTTAAVTRAADSLSFQYTKAPQGVSIYAHALPFHTGDGSAPPYQWSIGGLSSVIFVDQPPVGPRAVASNPASGLNFGGQIATVAAERLEMVSNYTHPAGVHKMVVSRNGASPSGSSVTQARPITTFGVPQLLLTRPSPNTTTGQSLARLVIAKGSTRDLAYFRNLP